MGHPINPNANSYEYNNLSINVNGPTAGRWYNFKTGDKGNLIGLVQHQQGCDFKQALQYVTKFLNIDGVSRNLNTSHKQLNNLQPQEFTQAQLEKLKYAKQLEKNSIPIINTIAETYLNNNNLNQDSFRFKAAIKESQTNKEWPALLVLGKNPMGETQTVHCVYLDPKTSNKLNIEVPIRTHGPQKDAITLIANGRANYALANDLDSALTLANKKTDLGIYMSTSLENFINLSLPRHSKEVLLCVEQDGFKSHALHKVIDSLAERGLDVYSINKHHEDKVLLKNGLSMEQLIENHKTNTLVSEQAKNLVDFCNQYTEYKI